MFFSKKQLEVNKLLLAAPGRASHGHGNKTALDENTDAAEQSDESRVQHKMLVQEGFLASFPQRGRVRQLGAPRLLPDPKCADQPQQHLARGRICPWRVVGFAWGEETTCMRLPRDESSGTALGGTLPAPRPAADTQHRADVRRCYPTFLKAFLKKTPLLEETRPLEKATSTYEEPWEDEKYQKLCDCPEWC